MEKIRKFLIATSNPGKFQEIFSVLKDLSKDFLPNSGFDFFSSKDLKLNDKFEEVGQTHPEVGLNKARFYFKQVAAKKTGNPAWDNDDKGPRPSFFVLAEDSGIIVDELKGELGVKTRRWGAGESASDQEWIDFFLKKMEGVSEQKRTARFVCCAVLIDENGREKIFLCETEGIITHELQAPIKPGLPLSSCFKPLGFNKVYAAMTDQEKAQISHRGRAIHQVRDFLLKAL